MANVSVVNSCLYDMYIFYSLGLRYLSVCPRSFLIIADRWKNHYLLPCYFYPDWKVGKLKELGFSEVDCEEALTKCDNSMDSAAVWLIQNASPIPSSQYKRDENRGTSLSGIEVQRSSCCVLMLV